MDHTVYVTKMLPVIMSIAYNIWDVMTDWSDKTPCRRGGDINTFESRLALVDHVVAEARFQANDPINDQAHQLLTAIVSIERSEVRLAVIAMMLRYVGAPQHRLS